MPDTGGRSVEEYAIGPERVSVSIVLKTTDDKMVATQATERWYATPHEARTAVQKMVLALIEIDGEI